ncbi:polyprenyl synthetase family protein [Cellulomonas sp. SLBN-39]|uniref:polyprenyl synthetase family protein n=1 Tax=Cellulomonas sp. SLBN-39 TaxID=2768446 RepID=UPI00116A680C|nr:polyprenyl synthetase family protein [Cellulomonas sp. SLBN-39]TQL03058.1 geranylgeranyl diphosphate synthase type II [Cellulomonas sp. SLBN-39]
MAQGAGESPHGRDLRTSAGAHPGESGGHVLDLPPDRTAPGRPAALHGGTPDDLHDVAALAHRVEATMGHVERVLHAAVAERVARAGVVSPVHGDLWADTAAIVGGKLMRPRLTVTAYLGLGGADVDAVAPVAAAQEVLHTAMLVHDDLLDHDEVRRGRPNVAGATRARRAAGGVRGRALDDQVAAAAVLAGDAAIAESFRLITASTAPAATRVELVSMLAAGIETTVAGELLDVTAELLPPADVDPLLVAELKTAAYSFRIPLECGAVLAGARPELRTALALIGTALGLSYQLTDDDLGVFGDPQATGKSVLSDLRAGKRTELLRLGLARADAAGQTVLQRHVGRPDLDEDGAREVRAVLVDSGALDEVRALTRRTAHVARTLATTTLPGPLAGYLAGVVDDLVGRGH